jgi:hypothetical protein
MTGLDFAIGLAGFIWWGFLGYLFAGRGRGLSPTRFFFNWVYNQHVVVSQAVNAFVFFGDPDESVSGRIGKSIISGGWASRVRWPAWMRRHWLGSIEQTEGGNNAFDRSERV